MTKTKKLLALCLMFIMVICLTLTVVACKDKPREGTENIRIAHVSDTHIFIEDYCNTQSSAYIGARSSTKLLQESQQVIWNAFEQIYELSDDEAPMYMVVTGDLTSNGEVEGHRTLANMLGRLTTMMRARKGFEGFQIFVTAGNHDLYNDRAETFMPTVEELQACASDDEKIELLSNYHANVTTCDNATFMEIYADFGYGGKNCLASCEYFYNSDFWYEDNYGVTVQTPAQSVIDAYEASDKELDIYAPYARHGATSYIARINGFTLVALDGNGREYDGNTALGSQGWTETTGGYVSERQLKWINAAVQNDIKNGQLIVAAGHQNFLPHFDMEDDILSLFTYDNFEQVSYTLADIGVRYGLTGHMHSNDTAHYVSPNGDVFYDFETGSLISYGSSFRILDFTQTFIKDGTYYEDLKSTLYPLDNDVLVYNVIAFYESGNAIIGSDGSYEKVETKTFDKDGKEIGFMDYMFMNQKNLIPDMIYGMVNDSLFDTLRNAVSGLSDDYKSLALAAINDLEKFDFIEPIFNSDGSIDMPTAPTKGYNLVDLATDLVDYILAMDLTCGYGDEVYDIVTAFVDVYNGHLTGSDSAVMTDKVAAVIEACNDGSLPKKLVGLLIDVLIPELQLLLDAPVRYENRATAPEEGTGFDLAAQLNSVSTLSILGIIKKNFIRSDPNDGDTTLGEVISRIPDKLTTVLNNTLVKSLLKSLGLADTVNSIAPMIIEYATAFKDYDGDLDACLSNVLLDKYLTEALYCNVGNYLGQIVESFAVDYTEDGAYLNDTQDGFNVSFTKDVLVRYSEDVYEGHTYYRDSKGNDKIAVEATKENGKLPSMISLSYGSDPTKDIIMKWFTFIPIDINNYDAIPESYIKYWKTSEGEGKATTTKATSQNVSFELPTIDLGLTYLNMTYSYRRYNQHDLVLSLAAGTEYSYKLGNDAYGWSEVYSFATAPASGDSFTVLGITDIQGSVKDNYLKSLPALEKALDIVQNPAFIIDCGDNVDDGNSTYQWEWMLNVQHKIWANNILVSAVGNHEDDEYAISSKVAIPNDATVEESGYYYSFDYLNTHFVVLNTNDLNSKEDLSEAQTNWLKADLDATNSDWIVVILHKGPFTAGSHAFDSDVIALRAQLAPLFAQYGVDLVLEGHDHTYSVSEFILGDVDYSVDEVTYNDGAAADPDGVLYINLGTIGDKFYNYIYSDEVSFIDRSNADSSLAPYITEDGKLEITANRTFMDLTVEGKKMIITTYLIEDDGDVITIDEITIVK